MSKRDLNGQRLGAVSRMESLDAMKMGSGYPGP